MAAILPSRMPNVCGVPRRASAVDDVPVLDYHIERRRSAYALWRPRRDDAQDNEREMSGHFTHESDHCAVPVIQFCSRTDPQRAAFSIPGGIAS